MTGPLRIARAEELDPAALLVIVAGAHLELAPELLDRLAAVRAAMLAALADGRAVYGVNTGMGAQSGVRLSVAEQGAHQDNLLLARAAGGPPWLSRPQVRALLAVRLRTLLNGDAGVSPAVLDQLVRLLNCDVLPAVPAAGYGSAGEIIALAHASGPLIGIGAVLSGPAGRASDSNGATAQSTQAAAVALNHRAISPITLGAKDGVALLQGVPGTTALAILLVGSARRFIEQTGVVVSLGLVATSSASDSLADQMARGDVELAMVNAAICRLVGPPVRPPRALQAPVSYRVAGAVLAHLTRSVQALEAAIARALSAVSDSPAYVDGQFHASAGFFGLDLAANLDALSVALVQAAEVSCARTHRLLDTRFSGLNDQLAERPGPDAGLVAVHKRSAGVLHQLRRTASPSIIATIETSFGQEDVQSFSWEAAANAGTALAGATEVLAGELFVAARAHALSGRALGSALAPAVTAVNAVLEPGGHDRILGPEIEAVRRLLVEDELPT